MAHACLDESDIILGEMMDGLEEWVNLGHISAFGVGNIIQNGSLNFGKKTQKRRDDMSWNELKNDIGGVYVFIKWIVFALIIVAVVWTLKSCTWEKYWDSGLY